MKRAACLAGWRLGQRFAPAEMPAELLRVLYRSEEAVVTRGDQPAALRSNNDSWRGWQTRCVATARNAQKASMPAKPSQNGAVIAVIAVGWRLLTVPFCRGFAGIEAFNAFMAVKSQYFLFSTGTDNPFERGVPDNNV